MARPKHQLSEQEQYINNTDLGFRIINAVKQHPVLYNTVDVHFRINTVKEKNNAWDNVATEVGITVVEVRTVWKKLRDQYRVHLKRQKKVYKQKRPLLKNKVWKYHKEMQFLLPFMHTRKKLYFKCSPNLDDISSPNNNMMNDNLQDSVNEMAGSYSDIEGNVNNKVLYPYVELGCNVEPLYGVDEDIKLSDESLPTTAVTETVSSVKIKPDQLQSKQNQVKIDPTDIFFYSMSEATKNLPHIVQLDIKRKVLDVVNSIEKEAKK